MKVLMISSDRNMFKSGSAVSLRMQKYAKIFTSLDIIIFTHRKSQYTPLVLAGNIRVYPTNSRSRWMYVFDAMNIVRNLERVDVVTPQDPFEAGLVGVYASYSMKSRLHIQIHTDPFSVYFRKTPLNNLRYFIMQYVIRKANSIRVVSDRVRQSLLQRKVQAPIHVLPIYLQPTRCVDDNTSQLSIPPFRLLTVGRLEYEKNILQLILAVHILHKRNVSFTLDIVGDGSLRAALGVQIRKLGLEKICRLVGEMSDIVCAYQTSHVYIHTSLYEGFGATLYEAAGCGIPIISTDVGLIGSIIPREYVTVISPNNPLQIAQAIEDVIMHLHQYKKRAMMLSKIVHQQHLSEAEYLQAYCQTLS